MPEAGVVVCLLRSWDDLGFEIRAYLFLTRDAPAKTFLEKMWKLPDIEEVK